MMDSHGGPELTQPGALRFTDAHLHLDDPAFDPDRDEVLRDAAAAGVCRFVVAGYSPDRFDRASALRSEGIRVASGIHPWTVAEASDETIDRWFAELRDHAERADALGEFGLDAVDAQRRGTDLARQSEVFRRGLVLAREVGLPIVLHVVRAHAEAQAIIRALGPLPQTMVHAFSSGPETARGWLELGCSLSFGGDVHRSPRARDSAAKVPLDRMLLESDAPHGSPRDGSGRGSPASVADVARTVAAVTGREISEIALRTWQNSDRMFFRGRPSDRIP